MPLDSNYNETCDELFSRFTKQFDDAITDNKAYKTWAGHLAEKCERIINCDVKHNLSTHEYTSINTLSRKNYTSEMCYILDLFNGPVGECMDYIRNEYGQVNLVRCAQQQRFIGNLKSVKKGSMKDVLFDSMYQFEKTSTCDSLFHNCTRSIMESECGSEVLELIDSNQEFLMHWNCTGFELFSNHDLKVADAAEDFVGELMQNRTIEEARKLEEMKNGVINRGEA